MKKILNVITLVMTMGALMFMQSCKKEETGSQIFYATIQQYNGDKVYINDRYSCWVVGDQIRLSSMVGTVGMDNYGRYIINFPAEDAEGHEQHVGYSGGQNTMTAIYPAALFGSNFNLTHSELFLEPTQLYEEVSGHQKLLAPMVAVLPARTYEGYPESNTLEFKNVCALLKVNVSSGDATNFLVTRIEVENTGMENNGTRPGQWVGATLSGQSGRPLWGDFKIAYDDDMNPTLVEQYSATDNAAKIITKEVTLECEHHGEGGVAVSGTHPFYIFLPPVDYDQLHVTVYALVDGHEKCKTLISGRTDHFNANTIYPLGVSYDNTWITIPRSANEEHQLGPYSVSSNKRVEFSFANLHYDGSYYFPPYQYDFIGYHDPNGDHDHFNTTRLQDVLRNYQTTDGWTLLTQGEWRYLLGPADDGTITSHRGGTYRFVSAIVASVPGIILFPDGLTTLPTTTDGSDAPVLSSSAANLIIANKNLIGSPYTNTIISIPDFYALEHIGCVFLPCVYYTSTDEGNASESVSNINDKGYYWEKWNLPANPTETPADNPVRLLVEAGSNTGSFSVAPSDNPTAFIRLVKNYTARTE